MLILYSGRTFLLFQFMSVVEWKGPLGHRRKDNIKIVLKGMWRCRLDSSGSGRWTLQWIFRFCKRAGNFLITWETINFSWPLLYAGRCKVGIQKKLQNGKNSFIQINKQINETWSDIDYCYWKANHNGHYSLWRESKYITHMCLCQHFGCSWLVLLDSSLKAVMNILGYWKFCGHCASLFYLLVGTSHKWRWC